jgi:GNAT superfamily N-acetyltransferase
MQDTIIKEIKDLDSLEFKQFLDIYLTSFPAVETKPVEKIISLLKSNNYHLYVVVENNCVIGFSLLYVFESLGIGLLDYMAMMPKKQGLGIGTQLFKFTLEQLRFKLENPLGMLLEIQNDSITDSVEYIKRKNRLKFYVKLGVKVLEGVHYMIPPQHGNEAEETYLMIAPLQKINEISSRFIVQCVNEIHQAAYQYMKTDLIDRIKQTLPSTIRISAIELSDK